MELRQIRQFLALADSDSLTAAAAKLHMAQPPLSVAMKKLEGEIGVPLFERSARGIRLTEAGAAAAQAAKRCLDQAEEITAAARSAASGNSGRLRIGFIRSVTFELMPRLIQTYTQRFPGVKLVLLEAGNEELLHGFESGALDLIFLRFPVLHPSSMEIKLIKPDKFVVALSPNHPLARQKKIALHDLPGHPFIGYAYSRVGGLHSAVQQLLASAGVMVSVTQEAAQVQTVLGLVESGLGLALVPSVNASRKSRLTTYRPLSDSQSKALIGIALGFNTSSESSTARRFRELVCDDQDML